MFGLRKSAAVAAVASILALTGFSDVAIGKVVALNISGSGSDVWGVNVSPPPGQIAVGAPLALQISYDTAQASFIGHSDFPGRAFYSANMQYALSIGEFKDHGSEIATFWVDHDAAWAGSPDHFDGFGLSAPLFVDQNTPPFDLGGGTYDGSFNFEFIDNTATAFSDFSFPDRLDPNLFDQRKLDWVLVANAPGASPKIVFASAPLSFSEVPAEAAVPEPDTWWLLIIGLGGAGALMRSRRRKSMMGKVTSPAHR